LEVALAGVKERVALVERLAAAGFGDAARFALAGLAGVGESDGANRNLLLLLTDGEAFLSVDDDTESRFACSPEYRSTLEFETGRRRFGDEPEEIWSYPDRESLLSSVPLFEVDPLECHAEVLGRRVRHLAAATRMDSLMPAEDRIRACDTAGRVMVSLHGLVGDCGWGSPTSYLFVGESSFDRLAGSDRSYEAATTSRTMLRVSSSLVVAENATNLMSTAFAADNRRVLPPWMPVGRGSDVVFGQTLKHTHPGAWFGHQPWAVLHTPVEKRRFWPGEVLRGAATTDIRAMFSSLLSAVSVTDYGPDENLRRIGRTLAELGNRSVSEFCQLLIERTLPAIDGEIAILENRLERTGGPHGPRRRDLAEYLQRRKDSRGRITAAIPAELLYGRDVDQAIALARRIVLQYGELLSAWPDMVRFIRGCKEEIFAELPPVCKSANVAWA
jgi:hypothetical protein